MRPLLFAALLMSSSFAWADESATLSEEQISTFQDLYAQAAYLCNGNYGDPVLSIHCNEAYYY